MTDTTALTAKDFRSDQEVRWCPGCGDYSILANFQRTLPTLGIPKEKHVVVGGIGCSSRFPYYMNTFGVHSIHGRAPAVATGIKAMNPDLTVWVITGDGDGLSIGGNHLLHTFRRNVDLKILLFNNRIYGLTKGQYSPTSEPGKVTKSSPVGSIDYPVDPVRFALAAGATFVARTLDVDAPHFQAVLARAAAHKGTAFIEIYQNCPIYNDDTFIQLTDKKTRPTYGTYLEHGKPILFGEQREHGIRLNAQHALEVVPANTDGLLVHDEGSAILPEIIAKLEPPSFPRPLGVFRNVSRPTYDDQLRDQVKQQQAKKKTTVQDLLTGRETWTVK